MDQGFSQQQESRHALLPPAPTSLDISLRITVCYAYRSKRAMMVTSSKESDCSGRLFTGHVGDEPTIPAREAQSCVEHV